MCGLCFAGLLAARFVGFSNLALVPLAGGLVILLWMLWVDPPLDSHHRPARSPTPSAACSSAGRWRSSCGAGPSGRCGRSARSASCFALTIAWELGEWVARSRPDTDLIPNKRDSAIDIAFGTLGGAPERPGARCCPSGRRDRLSRVGSLDGRVIAIAGAAGGLGPVVAERLADAGATLALTDRDQGRLDEVVADLALAEERVDARVADLLDEADTGGWAQAIEERFGRVDGLLHLVGGWKGGEPIATAPLEDYEWLHDLLVRTVIHTTRAFYDALAGSEHGRFVLVSSSQAQSPGGTNAAYGATKAAAESWTLALADAFRGADSAATANIVVVNAIVTPRMRAESPDKPFKTFTSAEEIAAALEFVCSDAARKMNGKRLPLYP